MRVTDDMEARIAELCAMREDGIAHLRPSDAKMISAYWDENDPLTTVSGDYVGKLFPELLDYWLHG